MGWEKIGGPKREQKSLRQEALQSLKQKKQSASGAGMSRSSKLLTETITRNKGGLSKSQIQRRLQKIKNKLRAGGRLTGEEKEFLRQHAPELYRKVVALEREVAAYEERLKAAKTREDAENIQMTRMMMSVPKAKEGDPEFEMIRIAQLQAAEVNLQKVIWAKPKRSELSRESRERLERAAKKQANTERRMKRLRRWNDGRVEEVVSEEGQEIKGEQGTPEQGLTRRTRDEQERILLEEVRMGPLGEDGTEERKAGYPRAIGISRGKAVYSAMATKVTDKPSEEKEQGKGDYNRRA